MLLSVMYKQVPKTSTLSSTPKDYYYIVISKKVKGKTIYFEGFVFKCIARNPELSEEKKTDIYT